MPEDAKTVVAAFPPPVHVDTNGIRMAVYEQGQGPAVLLLHGFPELAFSWRHQLPALAAAGYRAIAPDQRGYGKSDVPGRIEDYTVQCLAADVEGLLDALAIREAVFVGHDWGALLTWTMALMGSEKIAGIINLNIPFHAAPPVDPIALMRQKLGDDFYIVNFQDGDDADKAFAADVPHFFNVLMRRRQISREQFNLLPKEKRVLSLLATMARSESGGEPLLNDDELAVYVAAFKQGGFSGPINWYRNWSHNWSSTRDLPQKIHLPVLFIGAHDDVIIAPEHIEAMKPHLRDLEIQMIEDCGHWSQQERPEEVNGLMLDWLARRFPP
jgi:soluble epoxide hydrolase/lipid-phosphate phosphatase